MVGLTNNPEDGSSTISSTIKHNVNVFRGKDFTQILQDNFQIDKQDQIIMRNKNERPDISRTYRIGSWNVGGKSHKAELQNKIHLIWIVQPLLKLRRN
jgi:hypothetical protein